MHGWIAISYLVSLIFIVAYLKLQFTDIRSKRTVTGHELSEILSRLRDHKSALTDDER